MAYDTKTFGQSPFGQTVATTADAGSGDRRPPPTAAAEEALSDQIGDSRGENTLGEHSSQKDRPGKSSKPPVLPVDSVLPSQRRRAELSAFYLPQGRVGGLNLLGEAVGWLLLWGTVGFFRAYIPAPVLAFFDRLFHPYCTAAIALLSALLIGQFLKRYEIKIASLRLLATAAIEYGEARHQADAQTQVVDLLSTAEARTAQTSRWLVSWLTALGCLFVIGAFY